MGKKDISTFQLFAIISFCFCLLLFIGNQLDAQPQGWCIPPFPAAGRHLWSNAHTAEGLNTEVAVYSGMAGLLLLYNIVMFAVMVFLWTGND